MYEQMFSQVNEQLANLTAPGKKLGALVLDNAEKLAAYQLESVKSYSELGLKQARAALEIQDPKQLQSYFEGQVKVANDLSKKIGDDAKKLAQLGEGFNSEIQKIVKEAASTAAKATKAA